MRLGIPRRPTETQRDQKRSKETYRPKETQRDSNKLKETQGDPKRLLSQETQRDPNKLKETQGDSHGPKETLESGDKESLYQS